MVELGTSLLLVIRFGEAVDDPALGGTVLVDVWSVGVEAVKEVFVLIVFSLVAQNVGVSWVFVENVYSYVELMFCPITGDEL